MRAPSYPFPTPGTATGPGPGRPPRRAVLAALAVLAGATLPACAGTGAADRTGAAPAPGQPPAPAPLVWGGPDRGLDRAAAGRRPSLESFTRRTGLEVDYLPEAGDETTWARLSAAAARGVPPGRDLVVLGDATTARLLADGGAQALDPARLPGLSGLLPALRAWPGDPGRGTSLPWRSSYVGLVWNTQRVGVAPATVADLWRDDLRGRVVLPSDWHDGLGVLAMAAGATVRGPAGEMQAGLRAALGEAQRQRLAGRLLPAADPLEALLEGRALAGVARSADVQGLQQLAPGRFSFVVPDTGALLVGDNLVVPKGATRLRDVLLLLDHYLQPAVAAAVSLTVPGLCPVIGGREEMDRLDPRRAASPLLFPTDADLARCQVLTPLRHDDERQFAEAYARVARP